MSIRFFEIPDIIGVSGPRSQFVLDLHSQLSDSFNGYFLVVVFMTIDGKEQVGYQSCKDLNHESMLAPGNQVVYLQMPLPPGEEVFYIPAELIGCRHLLRRKVMPVCGNPVSYIVDFIPDQRWPGFCGQVTGVYKWEVALGLCSCRSLSLWQ